eukprot:s1363_g14.t3
MALNLHDTSKFSLPLQRTASYGRESQGAASAKSAGGTVSCAFVLAMDRVFIPNCILLRAFGKNKTVKFHTVHIPTLVICGSQSVFVRPSYLGINPGDESMLPHFLRVLLALCAVAERSFFESGAFSRGRGRLALEEVSSDDITVNEVMAALQELGISNGTGSALDPDANPEAPTASKEDNVESEVSKDVVDILKEANTEPTESTEAPSTEAPETSEDDNNAEPGDADASKTAPETSEDNNNAEPGDADASKTAPETPEDNNNAEPGDDDASKTAPETPEDNNNAEPGDADASKTADNSEEEVSGEKHVQPEASAEHGVERLGYKRFRSKQHKDLEDVSKFPAMVNALEDRAQKVILKSKRWKALLEKINQGHKNFTQLLKLFRLAVKRNHMAKVGEVATVLKSKGNASSSKEADVNVTIPAGHDVEGHGGQDPEEDDKHAEELTKAEKQLFKDKQSKESVETETKPPEASGSSESDKSTDEDDADDDEPTESNEAEPNPDEENSSAASNEEKPAELEPSGEEKKNQTNATAASANSSTQEKNNQTNATAASANSSTQEKNNQTNATAAPASSSTQEKNNQTNATAASANSSTQDQTNATAVSTSSSSTQEKTGPPDCKNRKDQEKGSATWCACNAKAELISNKESCEHPTGGRDKQCQWSDKEVCVPKAS